MLTTTTQAVRSIMAADPSITPTERNRLLALLRQGPEPTTPPTVSTEPRLLRRAEVARRLSVSLRTVDNLNRTGVIQKVKFSGRIRAAGFKESDIVALIQGGAGQ